tara:strand:+ start:60 stop:332 length:273 start_codon:yes stop_codon:yes gene_type:complete
MKMNKLIISVAALWILSACSAGQIAANNGGDGYVYVGCHVVTESPSSCCGAYAFGPVGDRSRGEYIWWKQINLDGTVDPITTARPCEEGE